MPSYEDFAERRVKHLEMLQAVIARLGTDSFLVKGWAVTVVGAFLGFAVNKDDVSLALVGLVPCVFFWGLDAYFLRAERLFRHLFEAVREGRDDVEPFFMAATAPTFVERVRQGGHHETWWRTARRPTLVVFYGALTTIAAIVSALLC
jgi:hypothetical protein